MDERTHEHDRGLAHDLGTMLTRRRALYVAGITGASALAACASRGTTTAASSAQAAYSGAASCAIAAPQETAGPFPGDGSNGPNVLIEAGIVRSDIRSSFGSYSGTAEECRRR